MLKLGRESGKSVCFIDPAHSPSLAASMEQLAGESLGIKLSYLADLLNLDLKTARNIGRTAVVEEDLDIDLEG